MILSRKNIETIKWLSSLPFRRSHCGGDNVSVRYNIVSLFPHLLGSRSPMYYIRCIRLEDVPLVEFMYLVFSRVSGESYCM